MRNKINIVHVLGTLDAGGAETMVMNIYRNIDKNKFRFSFIVHGNRNYFYERELNIDGVDIFRVRKFRIYNIFSYSYDFYKLFKREKKWDIVHGHARSTASIYLLIAKCFKIKTICHSHSNSSSWKINDIVKKVLQYPIRYIADYFFACSLSAGEWLFGKKIVTKKEFRIIYNSIDVKRFSYNTSTRNEMRTMHNLNNEYVIGNIARYIKPKNHDFMIDIAYHLSKNSFSFKMVFVGDGDLKEQLMAKIVKMNLEKYIIMIDSNEQVEKYYQMFDLFLFPSLWEGLGMVLVEAQTAGLQCIVSEVIQPEAIVTDLVTKIELSKGAQYWAEVLMKTPISKNRDKELTVVEKTNYNIRTSILALEKLYQMVVIK